LHNPANKQTNADENKTLLGRGNKKVHITSLHTAKKNTNYDLYRCVSSMFLMKVC